MTYFLIFEGALLAMAVGIVGFVWYKKRERRQGMTRAEQASGHS